MYEMITGTFPWHATIEKDYQNKIARRPPNPIPDGKCDEFTADMIEDLLQPQPAMRLSFEDLKYILTNESHVDRWKMDDQTEEEETKREETKE